MQEREKQVKKSALIKMETYLNDVYLKIGKGEIFSLDALARQHKLSGSVATLLKRQNIVEKISTNNWSWVYSKKPDRALALVLMDEVNRVSGKWKDGDMLTKALSQSASPMNLFNQGGNISERVYLIGCIATGIYEDMFVNMESMSDDIIDKVNERITFVTDNLINHIHKPKS